MNTERNEKKLPAQAQTHTQLQRHKKGKFQRRTLHLRTSPLHTSII